VYPELAAPYHSCLSTCNPEGHSRPIPHLVLTDVKPATAPDQPTYRPAAAVCAACRFSADETTLKTLVSNHFRCQVDQQLFVLSVEAPVWPLQEDGLRSDRRVHPPIYGATAGLLDNILHSCFTFFLGRGVWWLSYDV
jgi:hypothetical protein